MKKIISLILCVLLAVGAVAVSPVSVSAYYGYYTLSGKMTFGVIVSSPINGGIVSDVRYSFDDGKITVASGENTPVYTYQWLNDKDEVIADNQSLEGLTREQLIGKNFKLKVSIISCYVTELTFGKYYADLEKSTLYSPPIAYSDYLGKSKWYSPYNYGYRKATNTYEIVFTFDPVVYPVDKVDINLPAPVDGEYPELYPSVPDGTELNAPVVWEDKNDHVSLLANALFKKGHTYSCEIQLKLKDYYYWADNPVFTINGNSATAHPWYSGSDYGDYYKYKITYEFPPAPAKKYNLWLGDTQVTDDNRSDILGDGKAKFDPATNTLTLNKATISGSHTGADGNAASIYAEGMDLTVKGSGTIGNDNVGIGICQYNSDLTTNCSLTLDGNFTFKGEYGVFTAGSLTIDGGTITSTGTIMALGDVQVNAGLNKLEVNVSGEYGTFGSFAGQLILDPSLKITLPAGGKVKDNGIVDANGQFVTHVVIRGESETYILGDVDGDGEVTILDATAIQRHLASLPTKAYNEKAADVDKDDEVTILDATAIQRHLASLPTQAQGIGKPIA